MNFSSVYIVISPAYLRNAYNLSFIFFHSGKMSLYLLILVVCSTSPSLIWLCVSCFTRGVVVKYLKHISIFNYLPVRSNMVYIERKWVRERERERESKRAHDQFHEDGRLLQPTRFLNGEVLPYVRNPKTKVSEFFLRPVQWQEHRYEHRRGSGTDITHWSW